ncbi:AAEL014511-PA, partial [Aedes aegypti]
NALRFSFDVGRKVVFCCGALPITKKGSRVCRRVIETKKGLRLDRFPYRFSLKCKNQRPQWPVKITTPTFSRIKIFPAKQFAEKSSGCEFHPSDRSGGPTIGQKNKKKARKVISLAVEFKFLKGPPNRRGSETCDRARVIPDSVQSSFGNVSSTIGENRVPHKVKCC